MALYDVLKAQRVEDLGQIDFEQETKNRGQVCLIWLLRTIVVVKVSSLKHSQNNEIPYISQLHFLVSVCSKLVYR